MPTEISSPVFLQLSAVNVKMKWNLCQRFSLPDDCWILNLSRSEEAGSEPDSKLGWIIR